METRGEYVCACVWRVIEPDHYAFMNCTCHSLVTLKSVKKSKKPFNVLEIGTEMRCLLFNQQHKYKNNTIIYFCRTSDFFDAKQGQSHFSYLASEASNVNIVLRDCLRSNVLVILNIFLKLSCNCF